MPSLQCTLPTSLTTEYSGVSYGRCRLLLRTMDGITIFCPEILLAFSGFKRIEIQFKCVTYLSKYFFTSSVQKITFFGISRHILFTFKVKKDLLIFWQILNFKPLCATPATAAAVFYCNSSTTLASAMYYTMAESFVQKSRVLYPKWNQIFRLET